MFGWKSRFHPYCTIDDCGKVTYQKETTNKRGIHSSIQQLTATLMGYKRPLELLQAALIDGEEEAISQLEKLIPVQQTFFLDFY